jgi:hypothetical protein
MTTSERESITAKVAEYMTIGATRMVADILGCVTEDYGYATSQAIRTEAQKRASAPVRQTVPTVQRHRFSEVLDDAPRYRPNSLSPNGWPTDEDGCER